LRNLFKEQKRLTPLIISNIIDITEKYQRQGVMIFSSTVNHAKEILTYLPEGEAEIILGDTDIKDRDEIIHRFKNKSLNTLLMFQF
jgi:DNA repair protein RadD